MQRLFRRFVSKHIALYYLSIRSRLVHFNISASSQLLLRWFCSILCWILLDNHLLVLMWIIHIQSVVVSSFSCWNIKSNREDIRIGFCISANLQAVYRYVFEDSNYNLQVFWFLSKLNLFGFEHSKARFQVLQFFVQASPYHQILCFAWSSDIAFLQNNYS